MAAETGGSFTRNAFKRVQQLEVEYFHDPAELRADVILGVEKSPEPGTPTPLMLPPLISRLVPTEERHLRSELKGPAIASEEPPQCGLQGNPGLGGPLREGRLAS